MFFTDVIISMLNGIILLGFIYKFNIKTILYGFFTGLITLFAFVNMTNPITASILRMSIWFIIIFSFIKADKKLQINNTLKIFHIMFFLSLKILFEVLIYLVQNNYYFANLNRNNFICVIISWLPFGIIAFNYNLFNYNLNMLDKLNKKIKFVKVLNNILGTAIFTTIYFCALLFKKGV